MKNFALSALVLLAVSVASADPVEDLRNATNMAFQALGSPYNVTGAITTSGITEESLPARANKPAGSLNSTNNLSDIVPGFGLTGTVTLTGTKTASNKIRWILTAPGLIGQTIPIEFNGTVVNFRVTSFTGELNAICSNVPTFPDPVDGLTGRNVLVEPDPSQPNFIQVRGNVFVVFTATVRVDPAGYIGAGGNAPLGTTVRQKLILNDSSASPLGEPVTVQLLDASSNVVATEVTTLDSDGFYSVSFIPSGSFTVRAKATNWLSVERTAVTLNGTQVNLSDASCVNGDVDGDDSVTVFDYIELSTSFDLSQGDSGYKAAADLDRDNSITVFDYIILSNNFDRSGPTEN